MAITLERSESWTTYSTDPPKPVTRQTFENLLKGKMVKSFEWDKSDRNGWMNILFTDKSRLVISDGGYLIFVPDK